MGVNQAAEKYRRGSETHLYRYIDLPSAIQILREKTMILRDPKDWRDQNDTQFIRYYMDRTAKKTVRALCFTKAFEASYHWTAFSSGEAVVRLRFNRKQLEKDVGRLKLTTMKEVKYHPIRRAKQSRFATEDLPFIKRIAYEGEREVRVFYASGLKKTPSVKIKLSVGCLDQIVLSPYLHPKSVRSLRATLKDIGVPWTFSVVHSQLTMSGNWIQSQEIERKD